jgi:curved DNA-binding protein CbpA
MTLYDDLGLRPDCSPDDIKQRYRTLAQQHHPDKGGDEDIFTKIKLAYEVLSDVKRRQQYDSTGQIYEDISVRSEALQDLSVLVTFTISKINPDRDDLILKMKNSLNDDIIQINTNIITCNSYIVKLNKILKKVNRKKDGENFIKNIIEEQIKTRESELKSFKRKLEVCNHILGILEDYYYGLDLSTLLE